MRFPESILSAFKRYPYRQRLPMAIMLNCVLTWHIYRNWPLSAPGFVFYAVLYYVVYLDWKRRPFWFLWGIVVGAVLFDLLLKLHPLLPVAAGLTNQ
jgi:hypothetical protein